MRMLVVEDDPLVGRALGRTFATRGISIVRTTSCGAARAVEGHFDAGVFDIDLPDGDGITLAEDLLRGGVVHLAVFFSGQTEETVVARARLLGPFVHKAEGVMSLTHVVTQAVADALRALAVGGDLATVVSKGRSGIRPKMPR